MYVKVFLGFMPQIQQALNLLLNVVWIQTIYHSKDKDVNYLSM